MSNTGKRQQQQIAHYQHVKNMTPKTEIRNQYAGTTTGILDEKEADTTDGGLAKDIQKLKQADQRKSEIVWLNVVLFGIITIWALYGFYLFFSFSIKWQSYVFAFAVAYMSGFGVTVGAHRLWSHRAYKSKPAMEIMLMIFNCMAFQNSIYDWCRDHRVHHKFSETDADPHNAMRGFFFSHMGWLMVKKHPDVKTKGQTVDMSDLEKNPIVMFQHKYYIPLMLSFTFLLPTVIPVIWWGESVKNAWFVCAVMRWYFVLHSTWCINSVCHLFGNKPYDKSFNPGENPFISTMTIGECYHNYHHVFPWDYKAAELGGSSANLSSWFIEFFAKLGLAYDLKTVSPETIKRRVLRTGDGNHHVWGWGDKDQTKEERECAVIRNKSS
ncbi:acyl-CoA Delta-9 desaturase-like [Musca vetustissima]|uniref:acyl-CoA Delta-9 desaturase-like n=1 Tax=Musca vetustissima TaxID=27455 RepID=UPI002AB71C2D|nr:acyl-CoA Delta-9 desaturase-like [Musca vetustissima]